MLNLFYFLSFISFVYSSQCSIRNQTNHDGIYLCRQKLNSTSIRVWLHLQWNKINRNQWQMFSSYVFTLRMLDSVNEHDIRLEDRFEKRISSPIEIDRYRRENHTINLHYLLPGRYEICVNFFQENLTKIFSRSLHSCLHIPWQVPEYEHDDFNLFIHVLFFILMIILFITSAFFIYSLQKCLKSRKHVPVVVEPTVIEDQEEEHDNVNERARFLVNQHFVQNVRPLESLVWKRIHQRYADRSPDLDNR